MHTLLLIGVIATISALSVGMAAFFGRAWLQRRENDEYLYFALMSGFFIWMNQITLHRSRL